MYRYPVSEREKRTATNEALFREVNERVEDRVRAALGERASLTILCECADAECTERIPLTSADYETAHADGAQFVVLEEHVAADVEDVVSRHEGYVVVRKRGRAGEIARSLD